MSAQSAHGCLSLLLGSCLSLHLRVQASLAGLVLVILKVWSLGSQHQHHLEQSRNLPQVAEQDLGGLTGHTGLEEPPPYTDLLPMNATS